MSLVYVEKDLDYRMNVLHWVVCFKVLELRRIKFLIQVFRLKLTGLRRSVDDERSVLDDIKYRVISS